MRSPITHVYHVELAHEKLIRILCSLPYTHFNYDRECSVGLASLIASGSVCTLSHHITRFPITISFQQFISICFESNCYRRRRRRERQKVVGGIPEEYHQQQRRTSNDAQSKNQRIIISSWTGMFHQKRWNNWDGKWRDAAAFSCDELLIASRKQAFCRFTTAPIVQHISIGKMGSFSSLTSVDPPGWKWVLHMKSPKDSCAVAMHIPWEMVSMWGINVRIQYCTAALFGSDEEQCGKESGAI